MRFRDIFCVAAMAALTAVPIASAQERDRGDRGDRSSSRSDRSERVERWNDRSDRTDSQLHRDPYVGYTGRGDRWDEIRRSDRHELGVDRRRENDRDVQRELIEVRDRNGDVVDRSVIVRERRSSWSDDGDLTRSRVLRNPNIHGDRETIILDRRDRDRDDFLDRARHDRRDVDYVHKSLRHKDDDDRFLHRPHRDRKDGTYFSLRYRDAWDDDYPYIYHKPSHYRSYRYRYDSRPHFGYSHRSHWSRWYGYDCGPTWHSPRWRGPVIYRPYYHCPPGWSIRIDID